MKFVAQDVAAGSEDVDVVVGALGAGVFNDNLIRVRGETGYVGIGTGSPDEKFELEFVSNGTDIELGRGVTDQDVTFITLRSPNGTKYYLYPNDAGALVVTTTKP